MEETSIKRELQSILGADLLDKIIKESEVVSFPAKTEILRETQHVKVLPIVLEGLVKVYSRYAERELLLYYLEPAQSCIMTFYAALNNTPSKVFATTEEDSRILLLPVKHLPQWLKEFPRLNHLFYDQFNLRYTELLDTIGQLLLDKMDKRIYDHLQKKNELLNGRAIKMSHNQIANELGTAREVVSRILKKLEKEGKIILNDKGIKILSRW